MLGLKLPPPLKSVAALPCRKRKCLAVQLYSKVNSVTSDAKTFNYSKRSLGMLYLYLSTHINLQHVSNIFYVRHICTRTF